MKKPWSYYVMRAALNIAVILIAYFYHLWVIYAMFVLWQWDENISAAFKNFVPDKPLEPKDRPVKEEAKELPLNPN